MQVLRVIPPTVLNTTSVVVLFILMSYRLTGHHPVHGFTTTQNGLSTKVKDKRDKNCHGFRAAAFCSNESWLPRGVVLSLRIIIALREFWSQRSDFAARVPTLCSDWLHKQKVLSWQKCPLSHTHRFVSRYTISSPTHCFQAKDVI